MGWGILGSLLLGIVLAAPWQEEPLFGLFSDTPGVVSMSLAAVFSAGLVVLLWRLGGMEHEETMPRLPEPN